MSSIESIIALIAGSPGASVGLSAEDLTTSWAGMGAFVERTLVGHRSAIIPGFAHFVLQQHIDHSGTWGARVTYIPSCQLLPGFCAAYEIPKSPEMQCSHVSAQSAVVLNCAAITASSGGSVTRHGVMNAVKDIVRGIGMNVATGKPLSLNLGCCTLHFNNRRLTSEWSKAFLDRVNEGRRPTGRPATSGGPGSAPRVPQPPPFATSADDAPRAKSGGHSIFAAATKRPNSGRPSLTELALQDYNQDRVARSGSVSSAASSARSVASSARSTTSSARHSAVAAQHHRSSVGGPTTLAGAISPREAMAECRSKLRGNALMEEMSPHVQHKAKKRMFRRMRSQAFKESWEQSVREKRQATINEFEKDRRTAQALGAAVKEDEARREEELKIRKEEDRSTQAVNLELAEARAKLQLPRSQPSGDIFNSRLPTYTAKHDVNGLLKQIEEKQQREAREREENAKFAQQATEEYTRWVADQKNRKNARRGQQQQLVQEYELMAKIREAKDAKHAEEMRIASQQCGIDFSTGGDMFKERSRQIQRENYEMMKERAAKAAMEAESERRARDESRKAEIAREQALRKVERKTKLAQRATMERTWRSQMDERESTRRLQRDEERKWRDTAFLKNESSDSEDDAA